MHEYAGVCVLCRWQTAAGGQPPEASIHNGSCHRACTCLRSCVPMCAHVHLGPPQVADRCRRPTTRGMHRHPYRRHHHSQRHVRPPRQVSSNSRHLSSCVVTVCCRRTPSAHQTVATVLCHVTCVLLHDVGMIRISSRPQLFLMATGTPSHQTVETVLCHATVSCLEPCLAARCWRDRYAPP
jgi:hypothetical protein